MIVKCTIHSTATQNNKYELTSIVSMSKHDDATLKVELNFKYSMIQENGGGVMAEHGIN